MVTPLNQRSNDVFLSHSSRDKLSFVDNLYLWLTKSASLKVWYDRNLVSGQIASNLETAIDSSRAAIIVISENSVKSQWVELECSRLHEESARNGGDFRIVTIRLDDVDPPGLLKSFKHIDVHKDLFSANSAALLLDSLFGGKDNTTGRSVYISRGWRPADRPAAERIVQALQRLGLRLICDWTDQPNWDVDRIRRIMMGTGGMVAILPLRGNGDTSNYILKEIEIARSIGLPIVIFANSGIKDLSNRVNDEMELFDNSIERQDIDYIIDLIGGRIEGMIQSWRIGGGSEHVFLGHSLAESVQDSFQTSKGMLQRTTGLSVAVGGLVIGAEVQNEIIKLIQSAEFCVIDITNRTFENLPPKIDFALNSCIEAGIALGGSKDVYITCRAPRRSPPFMFRNKQIWYYENELDFVGVIYQVAKQYRRLVL